MSPYESKDSPLLPVKEFKRRLRSNIFVAAAFLCLSLFVGMAGYHWICKLGWVDSLLNSSMILTGMGPVDQMKTEGAKLFASFYAIFSGVAFLSIVAVIMTPIIHRFMHRFHLGEDNDDEN